MYLQTGTPCLPNRLLDPCSGRLPCAGSVTTVDVGLPSPRCCGPDAQSQDMSARTLGEQCEMDKYRVSKIHVYTSTPILFNSVEYSAARKQGISRLALWRDQIHSGDQEAEESNLQVEEARFAVLGGSRKRACWGGRRAVQRASERWVCVCVDGEIRWVRRIINDAGDVGARRGCGSNLVVHDTSHCLDRPGQCERQ